MEYRRFGRTGLQVSVAGLGTGGPSNLGQNTGVSETDAIRVVRRALDLGINLIDTAAAYNQSEAILGRALRDVPRDRYVLASKFMANDQQEGTLFPLEVLEQSLHESLRLLGVEYLDVFQFHGVQASLYDQVMEHFLPDARRWQQQGKFRFLGLSENFRTDGTHEMLKKALADDHFDTMMVGYNLLAPGAEHVVLPEAQRRDVGVMVMFAVRRVLSQPAYLTETIQGLKARGVLAKDAVPDDRPLDWLLHDHVESVPSAAYKFVAGHPAISTVLTGTGSIAHLEANVESLVGAPLPAADRARILSLFGHVEESIGN
ncbi:MAG: aldo/keto reductase [Dehalococcoidia bacterium]|nr:aldo/keto reductase [Dehalococcoidia bacterium]